MMMLDERWTFVLGTSLVHSGVFLVSNLLLFFFHQNSWFTQYKIQGTAYPDAALVRTCLQQNLVSHLLVGPLGLYFAYPMFVYFGMEVSTPCPGAMTVLRDLVVALAVNDTLFYWAHRTLHHKSIYKYVHKQHHEFKVPVGVCAEYANPIEDLLANILPTVAGCLVMGSHVQVLWLWLSIRILETVDAHSGYRFPLSPFHALPFQGGADRHDFHHSHNVGCYGSFTVFWDWACGTDEKFLEWESKRAKKA
ncbi:fatty acid hydroxylase superfamily-domain-containing protein [Ochromonadaceae sp. CCMP2298]|nr:fatty acid hydroxylase superfamily-domain-containing protein [Ochromonadaceae sp. CCMP2298]